MSYRTELADVDLGNLCVYDKAALPICQSGKLDNSSLLHIAKECTQEFFRQLFLQPTEENDLVTVSLLPKTTIRLPREKRLPVFRDLTRWERFAKLKGIKNKKKSRKVWDPDTKSWKPRWGKDRIDDVKDKWVIEVPDNADPYEDQFEKLSKARKERQAKNEFQRLRNISRSAKPGQAPPVGVLTESLGSKNEITRALNIAKISDASLGRFAPTLDPRKVAKTVEKKVKKRLNLSEVATLPSKKSEKRKKKPVSKKKSGKKKPQRVNK